MKNIGVVFLVMMFTPFCARAAEQWDVFEASFTSTKRYANPFMDVQVDVIFRSGDQKWVVPAFWTGGDKWTVRFAPPVRGEYTFGVKCSDPANKALNGDEQTLKVTAYTGDNPLLKHGFLRVAKNSRHFEHADGTPFFWLGDTWWKNLSKRMSLDDFKELTADRKAKGFSVMQIVCGPYPDEGHFEERWKNEAGFPYTARGFERVNPEYFDYADRRIEHLVEAGIVPAIVGGWGRGDCDGMALAGIDGMKRHWRYLIARYGAYPTIWIVGGESKGPLWTETARYVRATDMFDRPTTMHPHSSGRSSVTDESVINFDMLQTGHGGWPLAKTVIPKLKAAYDRKPPMARRDRRAQLRAAHADRLRGRAALRLLVHHAPRVRRTHLRRRRRVARQHPRRSRPQKPLRPNHLAGGHEFPRIRRRSATARDCWSSTPGTNLRYTPNGPRRVALLAGIPGEVRFIYLPNPGRYNWKRIGIGGLEPGVPYRMSLFDPRPRHERRLGNRDQRRP